MNSYNLFAKSFNKVGSQPAQQVGSGSATCELKKVHPLNRAYEKNVCILPNTDYGPHASACVGDPQKEYQTSDVTLKW